MISLTLELPEPIYHSLVRKADQAGTTSEELVRQWVEHAAQQDEEDPLLRLAGVFASDVRDIGQKHDEYIGQALISVEQYRQIIREIIQEYAQYRPARGDVQIETIFDEANDQVGLHDSVES